MGKFIDFPVKTWQQGLGFAAAVLIALVVLKKTGVAAKVGA